MPVTLQSFLAGATAKAADDLIAAVLRLPEDKRSWAPAPTARTALNQAAECALVNGFNVTLIEAGQWPEGFLERFFQERDVLEAQGWEAVEARLKENTARLVALIPTVPAEELEREIQMSWGKQNVASILAYSYWNMSYHLGQINYIASILGCLG